MDVTEAELEHIKHLLVDSKTKLCTPSTGDSVFISSLEDAIKFISFKIFVNRSR